MKNRLVFLGVPLIFLIISAYLVGFRLIETMEYRDLPLKVSTEQAEKIGVYVTDAEGKRSFTVSLNDASADELQELDGVGEKLAERIIEKREELGGFTSVEQLLQVKGIGPKLLEQIRPGLKPLP